MRVIIALLICLSCFRGYSQDEKAQITADISSYMNLFEKGEYEKTVNFIYPKLLTFVSADQLAAGFKNIFNNPDFTFKFSNSKIGNIGDIRIIKDEKFALVEYSYTMTMFIKDNDATKLKDRFSMLATYQKTYGEENVKYDTVADKYEIAIIKKMYAINSPPSKEWKFVDAEKSKKPFLSKILPAELLTDL
jgi:hypothetical protein